MINYFVIEEGEFGAYLHTLDKEGLEKFLDKHRKEYNTVFLKELPLNLNEIYPDEICIISGEIIVPKVKELATIKDK